MDTIEYNRNAWNLQSDEGCRWSTPFSDDIIEKAKCGDWSVILTPNHSVPKSWFPSGGDLAGVEVLALASGGGQQVPVLAAAGADVTSWDNSDVQLQKDADTCAAHGLKVRTYQGHMGNLAALSDESFDII
ncbi:MAG: class I SAM-dependent methyltransferase, partial [Verrucomicrobiota bacterium]